MSGADAPLLEARGLTKTFGDFTACGDISLAIRAGERHAILGENGAGKSTLVKMLYGALSPSAGEIFWRGAPLALAGPQAARDLGIGMVHQHFSLFEALTVAENVALALPGAMPRRIAGRIAELSREYGLDLDPARPVHSLSVGEKQRVEIVRCLMQDPKLLILDEPTSVLTPQEAETLFRTLHRLSDEGCAMLFISHRLGEVRALCEAATILRAGKLVATCDPRDETPASLAAMMIGRDLGQASRRSGTPGERVRLALKGLSLPAGEGVATALKDISLEVRAGEIVGIAGVAGEGQDALMTALIGERRTQAAMLEIDGQPMGATGPTGRREAGAAFVPEERNGHGAIPDMSLADNILLSHHRAARLTGAAGMIDRRGARDWAERVRQSFDVRMSGPEAVAGSLSGGNLQKFVVGREILRDPGILIVSQPTWGVDAGAAEAIRQALSDLAAKGAAILVISQDLEELFQLSDRIAVIHGGQLSDAFPAETLTPEQIGLLMAGADAA